jgi:hypothetical protein
MTKINLEKNDQPKAEESKEKKENGTVVKIQDFLKSKGQEGATAVQIGEHLGLIKSEMSKEETKSAAKKVRKFARDAVDGIDGGKRDVRNGKNKVYQILAK